jgi:hypothetical protein
VVESDGVTFVEPSAVTAPTSGEMVTEVALLEVQLRVEESPLLMEPGLAWSETVGFAAGGGAAAGGGGASVTFL